MNARYERFGQRWQPENMQQPIVNGIRIYMALKARQAGGAAALPGHSPGKRRRRRHLPRRHLGLWIHRSPDETAHGEYMKLMASAGLAFDRVHLEYLAKAKLRINRTEREQGGKVTWRIERLRPNLPAGETEPPRPAGAAQ